ncbi:cation diffusion facilitator family transporter [Thermobifida halotolerans]|uniref:Cation diffusion facilitator family transporter n=1 Tax=Thermobifida halotolerans TaxID=483545 RepID=A0AA97LV53_9ACTN|nr:cation diffusion facilitator family transporter [Thermobifida halotolerans]UOE18616.1 cation diffusion facilitator family transporter [Thermobifida halotolerans]
MSTEGSRRAIFAALAANLGIAVTKFVAYLLTNSSAMLAESIHSVADSGNQALLLVGGRRARRTATPEHPFGYGRARYVYAFLVAIVLFSLGGLFALYEAWHKISDPHPITAWHWVPVVVLVAAIVMETGSLRTAVKESDAVRGGASWAQFVRRSKSPELPVVLLEDVGALLGLVFALVGVGLTLLTGDGVWDGLGTAAIGFLLVAIAVVLAVEMNSLLIGESATPEHVRSIEEALLDSDDIPALIHMRTLHLGPDELLVAAKIAVDVRNDAREIVRAVNGAEARIRAAVPIARMIYLEPDLPREEDRAGRPSPGRLPRSDSR